MDVKHAPTGVPLAIETPEAAVARAQSLVTEATEIFRRHLHPLPPEQLIRLPPVPHEFRGAAIPMLDAIGNSPGLLALCKDLDPTAVSQQLALVGQLATLANRLDLLVGQVAATQETLLGQAYTSTLPAYRIAKAAAASDPTLELVVNPLKDMYANRKKPAKADETETKAQETPTDESET